VGLGGANITDNIAIGRDVLLNNTTGTGNSAVGDGALTQNTTAYGNTAYGYNSLSGNTTGEVNTAIGTNSLISNQTGSGNVAMGFQTGYYNDGSNNIYIGNSAGPDSNGETIYENNKLYINNSIGTPLIGGDFTTKTVTISGSLEVLGPITASFFKGDGSQLTNITASGIAHLEFNDIDKTLWNNGKGNMSLNLSFGERALSNNVNGDNHTAIGSDALYSTTFSYENTAIGAESLYNTTTGGFNTAIGRRALYGNTIGGGNVALGNYAGWWDKDFNDTTNSDSSIFIGYSSKPLGDNQTNQIVIGTGAIGSGSNTTVIGTPQTITTVLYGDVIATSFTGDGSGLTNVVSEWNGIYTGSAIITGSLEVTGSINVSGSIQVGNDSATASSTNVGSIRYRTSGNNSYADMVMQTGASTYEWVNIVQNNW
jgi:hypothetical protein